MQPVTLLADWLFSFNPQREPRCFEQAPIVATPLSFADQAPVEIIRSL
jgi:hypothetical protein